MSAPDEVTETIITTVDQTCYSTESSEPPVYTASKADPRLGPQAPFLERVSFQCPETTLLVSERLVTLADPRDPTTLLGQIDMVRDKSDPADETVWTKTYTNSSGKTIVTASPLGRERTQVLDSMGREVKSQTTGLYPTRREYDSEGRLTFIKEGPDPTSAATRVTRLGYYDTDEGDPGDDAVNGLLRTITTLDDPNDPNDPNAPTVTLEYDAAGRITKGILPDARQIEFTYDANGNVKSIKPPGRDPHGFDYTATNLEAKYAPPTLTPLPTPPVSDRATYFDYNDDGQLTLITRAGDGSETIGFTYDQDHPNQLRVKTLPIGQGAIHYDYYPPNAPTGAGQVQTIVAPDDGVLRYTYDCMSIRIQN